MYPDLIGAIKDGLYKETKDILVVDTSQRNDFHADVSVAHMTMLASHIRSILSGI